MAFEGGEFEEEQPFEDDAEQLDDMLQEVAEEFEVAPDAVRLTALLVLEGYDDEEILAHFRAITINPDGQHNPMDRVVAMIAGVREVMTG